MRAARLALVSVIVIGCASINPVATQNLPSPTSQPDATSTTTAPPPNATAPSVQPSSTPSTAPTASPTSLPTPSATPTMRATPTPASTSSAEQGQPVLLTWASNGYVTAQILLPVTNTGNTWISLSEFDSQWTIYDSNGDIVETGTFDAAAPKVVAPTGSSYLVASWFGDAHRPSEFVSADADGYYKDVDQPSSILVADKVKTRAAVLGGVEVVGQISNLGDETVDNADVVAVFYNSSGDLLGFASGFADNIPAMGTRSFQIDSSFADIKLSQVADTEVYASAWAF
jgi:hypothetical protein